MNHSLLIAHCDLPKSSSCVSGCDDEKPNAACQSVLVETGIVSGISGATGNVSSEDKESQDVYSMPPSVTQR
jgi:hypothetical protein